MSDTYVLDSFAILALLGKEAGGEDVAHLLRQAQRGEVRLLMTWINLGEVAYVVERRVGPARVRQVLGTLEATKITFVPIGRELTLRAATIKTEHRMAYAGVFAAALAIDEQAVLVTGDPEFGALEEAVSIHWLSQTK